MRNIGKNQIKIEYLVPYATSLALATLGAIMFFVGTSALMLIWIYAGTLVALTAYAAVGAVDAFYGKAALEEVEVEVPRVTVEEKITEHVTK